MKKWYAAVGVLAVALVINLVTCSTQMDELEWNRGQLADVKGELADVKAELGTVKGDLRAVEDDLAEANRELETVHAELARLKATKEINFGNGLKVFDIEYGDYYVQGKIQNISSTSMDEVTILVAFYEWDGSYGGYGTDTIFDLFPDEVLEWKVSESFYGSWSGEPALVDIYAIGNRIGE